MLIVLSACAEETAPPVSDNPFEAGGMPAPFEYEGGAENDIFYLPCIEKFNNYSIMLDEFLLFLEITVEDYIEITRNKVAWDFIGALGKTDLLETSNLFSDIILFNIPDEIVAESIAKHNKHHEGFAVLAEDNGWFGSADHYRDYKFNEAEIEALLSRDPATVLRHFATEQSIVIDDRVYPPAWLYLHTPEDYERVGITPEMVAEKLELYAAFNFSYEARAAFEEKLSEFIGETVELGTAQLSEPSIPPQENETPPVVQHNPFEAYGMPAPFEYEGGDGNHEFYLPNVQKLHETGSSVQTFANYLGVTREDFVESFGERLRGRYWETQDDWMRITNLFTLVIEFDIPNDVVETYFREYNNMQDSFNKMFNVDDYSERKFTDAEMEAILSRDPARVLEQFATQYAIVIDDMAYAPVWLYLSHPGDYERVGITPEMVAEKLELYAAFNFSAEARAAFEEKLSEFIGEAVELGMALRN
jgi:hypothetical protein